MHEIPRTDLDVPSFLRQMLCDLCGGHPYATAPGTGENRRFDSRMINESDVYRAAKLVIDQHGEDAGDFAARRADLLMEEGDADEAWRRILEAIVELQRERREDEALN